MLDYKNMLKEKYYEVHLNSFIFGEYNLCVLIGYKDTKYYINISNNINNFKYVIGPYETFTMANEKALFLISNINRVQDTLKESVLNIVAPHIGVETVNLESLETEIIEKHTMKYKSIILGEHTIKIAIREYPADGLYDITITNSENEEKVELQFYEKIPDTYVTWIMRNYLVVNEYLEHTLNAQMLAKNTLKF